ncbi:MAG: hypothetical protein QNJ55_04725 [Xenococcus sp. MO_188.B8]|nr:hypothetical protein [Xenococcus sp. MO_188.B8]
MQALNIAPGLLRREAPRLWRDRILAFSLGYINAVLGLKALL